MPPAGSQPDPALDTLEGLRAQAERLVALAARIGTGSLADPARLEEAQTAQARLGEIEVVLTRLALARAH